MKRVQKALISAIILVVIYVLTFVLLHIFAFKTKPYATMGVSAFIIFISYFALRFFDK